MAETLTPGTSGSRARAERGNVMRVTEGAGVPAGLRLWRPWRPWRVQAALAALAATLAAGLLAIQSVQAQQNAFPSRPIRLVVASAAGGTQDVNARAFARQVSVQLGQPVLVDNRAGANGIIGAEIVAKAPPDGHTLMFAAGAFVINPAIYRNLPFDVARDFTPITAVAQGEGVLVLVHPSVPATNAKELVALAKTRSLSYGSPGLGNALQLITESFAAQTGIKLLHVPYKGSGPALTALLSNEVQIVLIPPAASLSFIRDGRLRAVGYSAPARFSGLPDVPTLNEQGIAFQMDTGWHGLLGPARMSRELVERWHAEVLRAIETPALRDFFADGGFRPVGSTPADFRATVLADITRWAGIARLAKIEKQ